MEELFFLSVPVLIIISLVYVVYLVSLNPGRVEKEELEEEDEDNESDEEEELDEEESEEEGEKSEEVDDHTKDEEKQTESNPKIMEEIAKLSSEKFAEKLDEFQEVLDKNNLTDMLGMFNLTNPKDIKEMMKNGKITEKLLDNNLNSKTCERMMEGFNGMCKSLGVDKEIKIDKAEISTCLSKLKELLTSGNKIQPSFPVTGSVGGSSKESVESTESVVSSETSSVTDKDTSTNLDEEEKSALEGMRKRRKVAESSLEESFIEFK